MSGTLTSTSDLTANIASGAILELSGARTLQNLVLNTGQLDLKGSGNIATLEINSGTANLTNGTYTNLLAHSNSVTNLNSGGTISSIQLTDTATLNVATNAVALGQFTAGNSTTTNLSSNISFATTSTNTIGILSGNGSITESGGGKVSINSGPSYNGNLIVSNGIINLANPLGSGQVTVSNAGTLQLQSASGTYSNNATISGDGSHVNLENVSGTNTMSGNFTVGANAKIQASSGTLNISSSINTSANTTTYFGGSGTINVSGNINASTGYGINKYGSGTLNINNTVNNFAGTVVVDGGTVALNAANALGSNATGTVTINSSGTLQLGANQSLKSIGTYGALDLNGNTLTLGNGSTGRSFDVLRGQQHHRGDYSGECQCIADL